MLHCTAQCAITLKEHNFEFGYHSWRFWKRFSKLTIIKTFDLRQIKLNSTLKLDRTDLEFVVCWNALSISHFIQYMKKNFHHNQEHFDTQSRNFDFSVEDKWFHFEKTLLSPTQLTVLAYFVRPFHIQPLHKNLKLVLKPYCQFSLNLYIFQRVSLTSRGDVSSTWLATLLVMVSQ